MTNFQHACITAVENLADELKLQAILSTVDGKSETYVHGTVGSADRSVEVYIYEDEAGFYFGRNWHIHESQDYQGSASLILAFLADLRRALQAEDTVRP